MSALDAFGPRSWARPEVTGFGRVLASTYLDRGDEHSLDGAWAFDTRTMHVDLVGDLSQHLLFDL